MDTEPEHPEADAEMPEFQGDDESAEPDDELGRQRRQNVRVDVQYPIQITVKGVEHVARTRDISASGCAFSTRLPVEMDQEGAATIEFPDWKFSKDFVIRFIKPILAGWQVGVQYLDLNEDERERLVKEVFNVQRNHLQSRK